MRAIEPGEAPAAVGGHAQAVEVTGASGAWLIEIKAIAINAGLS